jgi:hypothetical protein
LAENRGVILFQCHRALFRMGSRGGGRFLSVPIRIWSSVPASLQS